MSFALFDVFEHNKQTSITLNRRIRIYILLLQFVLISYLFVYKINISLLNLS